LSNLPAAKDVDAEQSALENGLTLVLKTLSFVCWIATVLPARFWKRTDPWLAILPCTNIYWQASAPD
ncbi:multi-phosphoryl transfer 2 domain protein, partial [Shigella flexneri 1235-66]